MTVLDVHAAAEFLGVSEKTARALILRLPHGDVSRSAGPNRKLVIALETLEALVLGKIEPKAVGQEGNVVDIRSARKPKYRYLPDGGGMIPKRKAKAPDKSGFVEGRSLPQPFPRTKAGG